MPDVTKTVDQFIACVPVDDRRVIMVYHRQHGGREFVRWRYWHKHRTKEAWYPDKYRSFVVPLAVAEVLGHAIALAAKGEKLTEEPLWLARMEHGRDHRIACLRDLNAPAEIVEPLEWGRQRAWGERSRGHRAG